MLAKHWAAAVLMLACAAAAGASAQECYAVETDLKVSAGWGTRLWLALRTLVGRRCNSIDSDTDTISLLCLYGPNWRHTAAVQHPDGRVWYERRLRQG